MDSAWLTVLLSNDRWLFIEYFLGFVESVFFIHLCLWFQSVRCSQPWPLLLSVLFRHAHRYFKFFCTQENSFPFPFILKWCVFLSLLHLPFTNVCSGHGRAVHSLLDAVHTIHDITWFPPPHTHPPTPLRLSLAWKFSSVSVFYQVPILYRHGYWCVQGESPSWLGHFLPTAN